MESSIKDQVFVFGRMIKFSHTIFALPFALSAVVMAWKETEPSASVLFWIIVAMVGARSAAMGFNRIIDAGMDKENPRTEKREIPAGILTKKDAGLFVFVSSMVFVFAAAMLGKLCFWLSFPVLALLVFYSYTKRFTSSCHLYLGFAISLAPLGAWIAVTGTVSISILFLTMALMTYISGFDILYACQDLVFDRDNGLYSIPSAIGPKNAMALSLLLHGFTLVLLFAMYLSFDMHPVFLIFFSVIALLLVAEHWLVKPDDLEHINIAFFHMNSLVSVTLFAGVLTEALVR